MKKRLTGIITAAIILLLNTSVYINVTAEENVPTLIYSCLDFEEQQVGEIPYGFYWGSGSDGNFSVVNAPDSTNPDNKAMCLSFSGQGSVPTMQLPLHYAPISDSFVLGFRFKDSNVSAYKRIVVATGATQPRNSFYLDTTGQKFNLIYISAGVLHFGLSSYTVQVTNNTWYELEFEINVKTKKMNVYLNGSKVINQESATNTNIENVASLTFYAPSGAASDWCIDDFRLYMGDQRLSDEEFAAQWSYYEESEIIPEHKYELGRLFQYDKFVFVTLFNKFVARVDGTRFYKNNRYHTLSAPVTENNGVIIAPVRDFAEAFGAQVTVDNNEITVRKGTDLLSMTVGSSAYSVNGSASSMAVPVSVENGIACAPLDVLTAFSGIPYTRQGDLLSFGGELHCPYDLGVMGENMRGCTMEEEVFERIANSLVYTRPSKEQVLAAFEAYNPQHSHPRLLLNDFDSDIKNNLDKDIHYQSLVTSVTSKGNNYVNAEPVAYTKSDGLRADFQQPLSERGTYLSFSYKMTGNESYKNALWSNLQAVSQFPDLNPNHFLDVGVSANGIKFAYDWLADDWTEEQRQVIESIIVDKVLTPAIAGYRSPLVSNSTGFAYSSGNQPIIINCGIAGCALALMDKYPDICSEVVSCALRSVEPSLEEFAPDGAWTEGVSYWQYTMGSLPALVNIFRTALGDDFGLLSTPGLHKSAYFPLGVSGCGGDGTFPMGDDARISPYHSSLMWFANVYNDKALASMRKDNLVGAGITDVLNWVFDTDSSQTTIDNDHYFRKMETVTMRTGWSKNDTTAILHGGLNNTNHGHLDNGTFQIDMLGERFACEVPNETYNILYYGSYVYDPSAPASPYKPEDYYRYKAEGHNTVIANLGGTRADQNPDAFSEIIEYSSKPSGSYAILDMTPTNDLYTSAKRGLKLDKIKDEVIIQDDFRASQETEFWWFMHTQANISLSSDKKSAVLSKNNKRIWVSIISDGDDVFQVLPAQSLEGYYNIPTLQGDNGGYQKLAVCKTTDRFRLSVAVKALSGSATKPAVLPVYQPMESWSFDDSSIPATTYALKGISDDERIPVSTKASSLSRTISIVDANATARTVTAATNLAKADYYIDNDKVATVTDNPCQWELPLTDLNQHTLIVVTTDIAGATQAFGPYRYSAVYMEDGAYSFTEYFEGNEGESITKDKFSLAPRISAFTSTEDPIYAKVAGSNGTAMKLTMSGSNNTNLQTNTSISVPEQGITTVDMDVYCTSASEYYKMYLSMRNSAGYYMNKTNKTVILEDLKMKELDQNKWHHISFVFDSSKAKYCAFIDGYEFERGKMGTAPGRNVYFQFTTQNAASVSGDFYIDNLEVMSKTVSDNDAAGITSKDGSATAVVINSGSTAKIFDFLRAEYGENTLEDISSTSVELGAKGIWHDTVSTVPVHGVRTSLFIWDNDLTPLAEALRE